MATLARAQLKYLRIAPRKARSVADVIRGLSVNEAEAQLYLCNRRSAEPILKLLRSAVANAKEVLKAAPSKLVIHEIRVDQGPRQKRWTPRARGSASLIEKKQCHVTIVLTVADPKPPKFTFKVKMKKSEKEAPKVRARASDEKEKEGKEEVKNKATSRDDKGFRKIFHKKVI